tara:strand:- start:3782 stop:4009 length:228 start_codon:yes stop_codon:yes gene_type:complete
MSPDDLRAAYKFILEHNDGAAIMEDLELRFHVRSPVFSNDPYETAFRDGQRSVVLFMQNMLKDRPKTVEEIDLDG